MSREPEVVLSADAIDTLLRVEFPQIYAGGDAFAIETVGPMAARLRLIVSERHLRPGGTISGPTIFALADLSLYVAILAQIGPVTQTVTTSITLNFMRRPPLGDLVADCTILKLGRRLAVGEVRIAGVGSGALVAHATGTYAIPSRTQEVS